jgi:hypothetical protein
MASVFARTGRCLRPSTQHNNKYREAVSSLAAACVQAWGHRDRPSLVEGSPAR